MHALKSLAVFRQEDESRTFSQIWSSLRCYLACWSKVGHWVEVHRKDGRSSLGWKKSLPPTCVYPCACSLDDLKQWPVWLTVQAAKKQWLHQPRSTRCWAAAVWGVWGGTEELILLECFCGFMVFFVTKWSCKLSNGKNSLQVYSIPTYSLEVGRMHSTSFHNFGNFWSRAMRVTSSSRPQNSCRQRWCPFKTDQGYEVFSDPKLHCESPIKIRVSLLDSPWPSQVRKVSPLTRCLLCLCTGRGWKDSSWILEVKMSCQRFLKLVEEGHESIILRLLGSGGKIWRFLKRDWKADSGSFRPGLWDTRSSFHEEDRGFNQIVLSRNIGVVWLLTVLLSFGKLRTQNSKPQ